MDLQDLCVKMYCRFTRIEITIMEGKKMKKLVKMVKIVAFVAFLSGGELFGDDRFEYGFRFDTWSAGRWTDELKKSTPIKNNTKGKLQETKCKSKEDLDEGFTCFSGEIEVSGMLVRNDDDGRIDKPLYFIIRFYHSHCKNGL